MRGGLLVLVLSGCELIVGSKDVSPLTLDRLTISPGTIDQTIDDDTVHYTATVPPTDTVSITAHSADTEAQIHIADNPTTGNGMTVPVAVDVGSTSVPITIQANSVGVMASYTLVVNVAGVKFAEPVNHPLLVPGNPSSLDAADFNGDGTPDLLVGFANMGFQIYNGKTFGLLGGTVNVANLTSITVGDLDGVNGPDLVVTHHGPKADVFLNPGTGVFAGTASSQIGAGTAVISAAIGHIDNDANLDVILGDADGGGLQGSERWLLGNGNGTFGAVQGPLNAGAAPAAMVIGELDAMANPDVMVLAGTNPGLQLLRGNGAGVLANHGGTETSNGETPKPTTGAALVTGAFDANPRPDYALLHVDKSELRVVTNFAGDDSVDVDVKQTSFSTDQQPFGTMAIADLDGDGHPDLLVPIATNKLEIFYGDGAGGFARTSLTVAGSPTAVAVVDLDGDGKAEVVTVGNDSSFNVFAQVAP